MASSLVVPQNVDNGEFPCVAFELWNPDACANIRFIDGNGEEVGCLDWGSGQLRFTGNMDESARIFFETSLGPLVEAAVEARLQDEKYNHRL